MDLTFREDYWDTPELKREFIAFLVTMFGLDLSVWDKAGFWDHRYRPFSYFSDSKLVSNVYVYSMDLTINREKRRVAQISAVATIPEYRRKGLSLRLTQAAMDWARANHHFFFLFADDNAFKFYEQCGFRSTEEYKTRISVSGAVARPGTAKFDMQRADHVQEVFRIASNRAPVSDALGVCNDKLFMFWCLTYLKEHIHYISALDLLSLYKRESGRVTIFDTVGTSVPSWGEIYQYVCDPEDKTVDFLFIVDKLNLGSVEYFKADGNGTHLLGDFPLKATKFIFPFTSHA